MWPQNQGGNSLSVPVSPAYSNTSFDMPGYSPSGQPATLDQFASAVHAFNGEEGLYPYASGWQTGANMPHHHQQAFQQQASHSQTDLAALAQTVANMSFQSAPPGLQGLSRSIGHSNQHKVHHGAFSAQAQPFVPITEEGQEQDSVMNYSPLPGARMTSLSISQRGRGRPSLSRSQTDNFNASVVPSANMHQV